RRNVTRLYFEHRTRQTVCQLLESSRGPTSGCGRKSKESGALKMNILTQQEKEFLDVFLHEATTSPFFSGPATKALYGIGVEYHDISYISWAYDKEIPRTSIEWGHAADVAPPLPWKTRETALARNQEIRKIAEAQREPARSRNDS